MESTLTAEAVASGMDAMWVLISAALVFFMQAGFACLESGMTRAKNGVNVMMKGYVDFCLTALVFYIFGYAFMFGTGNDFIGLSGFFLSGDAATFNPSKLPVHIYWIFQVVFAGAGATILAGAIAERLQFRAYLVYILVISGVIYPIIGHWIWGGGWLAKMGFMDFAGSTVVHSVGGMAALAVAWLLGPRVGKFKPDGTPKAILGHNLPLAGLGTFILWLGWFGFNAGSALAVGDGKLIGMITLNTTLAASAGAMSAMGYAWARFGKPDLSFTLNGSLAGLVAITAPCAFVSPNASIIIGLIAGVLVCLSVAFIDKIKVDDAVGAISVHGTNGIFGTIAIGLWGQKALGVPNDGLFMGGGFSQLGVQVVGSAASCLFVFACVLAVTYAMKVTIGIRAHHHEEQRGLDISEHGMESYSGFQVFTVE